MHDISNVRNRIDWATEIGAGLMSSLVCLPLCLACGLLVFAPLGPEYAAMGAAASLYGGAIVGAVAALIATSSYIVSTCRVSMALVQAGLAATLVNDPALAGQPGTIVIALALCLLLAGVWQMLFGWLRFTGAIRYAPHPVLTGLLNGIGTLTIISQIKVFFVGASDLPIPNRPGMLVFVVIFAIFILNYPAVAARLRLPNWIKKIPGTLAGFLAGTAVYYLITALSDIDLGPTIGDMHISFPPQLPLLDLVDHAPAPALLAVLPHVVLVSLVLAIISTVETLLAFRIAQNLDDTRIHPVRDLAAQGFANAAAALGGGIGGSAIPSVTLVAHRAGGRTRWTGISIAISILVATFALSPLLAETPRAVFMSILLVVGIIMFDRWNIRLLSDIFHKDTLMRRNAIYNVIIVAAVMAVTVFNSVVGGVIVGIVLSSVIFVINMSRPLVRRAYSGDEIFSKRIRSAEDIALLQDTGSRRAILQLEGALFFGNADDLSLRVKELFERVDTVLLDLRAISDLDISGINVLRGLRDKACEKNRRLIYCNVKPIHATVITNTIGHDGSLPPLTQDFDSALEWMEERSIAGSTGQEDRTEPIGLDQIDFLSGVSNEEMSELRKLLILHPFKRGETVCREGDAGDRMWLIVKGSVSVRLRTEGDRDNRRIAGLGRGTTVGEMSLVESVPRSATIVADDDVVCYELTRNRFDLLLKDNPVLATKLLGNLARELTRRLRQTSQDLRFAGN